MTVSQNFTYKNLLYKGIGNNGQVFPSRDLCPLAASWFLLGIVIDCACMLWKGLLFVYCSNKSSLITAHVKEDFGI
jgi:hypothetical protein